jgi:hypothetical protein
MMAAAAVAAEGSANARPGEGGRHAREANCPNSEPPGKGCFTSSFFLAGAVCC